MVQYEKVVTKGIEFKL